MSFSQSGSDVHSRRQSTETFGSDYDNLSGLPQDGGYGPLSERAHEPYAEVIFIYNTYY